MILSNIIFLQCPDFGSGAAGGAAAPGGAAGPTATPLAMCCSAAFFGDTMKEQEPSPLRELRPAHGKGSWEAVTALALAPAAMPVQAPSPPDGAEDDEELEAGSLRLSRVAALSCSTIGLPRVRGADPAAAGVRTASVTA